MTDRTSRIASDLSIRCVSRLARQALMLRKKDLAERVGVSGAPFLRYENGVRHRARGWSPRSALALGVPTNFFASDRSLGSVPATMAHFRSLRVDQQSRSAIVPFGTWSRHGS